jgi:hypothetical protein
MFLEGRKWRESWDISDLSLCCRWKEKGVVKLKASIVSPEDVTPRFMFCSSCQRGQGDQANEASWAAQRCTVAAKREGLLIPGFSNISGALLRKTRNHKHMKASNVPREMKLRLHQWAH